MKEINLLPKLKQRELRYESVFRGLLRVIGVSIAGFTLVFLAQLGAKFYLENKLLSIQDKIQVLKGQVNKEENAEVRKEINNINNRIADFKNLAVATPKWSRVLKAFAPLPPSEVKINSFVIDFGKKSITITGFSPTREKVIETYDNIRADDKEFYNIDYPLENVAKAKDINFHFTFYIKDDLLK